ncbi:MAG: glycoside hydrolase family 88 protein [Treponema sp.]|jgi:unsaturated chondroitin disaccharide hydrolase|nr:glycoside hydrolase family 88 protein [Treponema sp.]
MNDVFPGIDSLKNRELFSAPPETGPGFWREALAFAVDRTRRNIPRFKNQYPAPASVNNVYPLIDNTEWTTSFWPGLLWLAWESTGQELFRNAAEDRIVDFRTRLDKRIAVETHDLGFLYTLACIAPWRLTGNRAARDAALKAADLLLARYYEKAGVIQAWGNLNDPAQRGRIIIDCAMNLPLLYWATGETGNPHYREAAERHIGVANQYLIRENWSTYHTYYFDTETGTPLRGSTAQGYADDSCWSRGQAWGIYGNVLSFRYLRNPELLEKACLLARYFLNRLPGDLVAYWDLVFTEGPEERDSSAGAIAACGLLELSRALPVSDPERRPFENAALHIMASLAHSYTTAGKPAADGILLHGVYGKPQGNGVDECTAFGDYFYMEALVRICRPWKPYW